MSSTPYIRLESFAAVVFLYMQVTVIVCQNAAISGCADSQLVDSSLTLNCEYIGNGHEVAIFWNNGSNSDIFALKPGSSVPDCEVFSMINSSFDPHRISYTCNALSNVYTLTINPLQKLDNNVTWSCTFIDPEPDPVKAECTIHLSETTNVTTGVKGIPDYVISIVVIIASIAVIIIFCIIWRKIKRRRKTYRCNKEQNAEVGRSLPEVPAVETDRHRKQLPTLSQLVLKETLFHIDEARRKWIAHRSVK